MKRLAAPALLAALAACRTPAPTPAPPPAEPPRAQAAPAPIAPRPEVLVARARVLRGEGDFAAAREQLEAALRASPDDVDARLELADLLVADGTDLARAEELLANVVVGDARFHLALAGLAEARSDDARAAFEYALALADRDDAEVRLRRALALDRLDRPEAIDELERVRSAGSGDAVVRSRLAERYEAAGRLAEAEAEFRWLAESQRDRAVAWERLARFYERRGRAKDALAASERAREAAARPARELRPLLPSKR